MAWQLTCYNETEDKRTQVLWHQHALCQRKIQKLNVGTIRINLFESSGVSYTKAKKKNDSEWKKGEKKRKDSRPTGLP